MPSLLIGVAMLGLAGLVRIDNGPVCFAPRELREVVESHHVVAPVMAIWAARTAVPGGEVLRASLCQADGELVYIVVALRRDGRIVHVTIDAPSGKVKLVR